MPAIFCVYGKVKIRYNVSMENLRTLLKEQMNIDFMSAVLSGPRTKDGTAKVKVRPLMKKDTLFFQLEIFPGTGGGSRRSASVHAGDASDADGHQSSVLHRTCQQERKSNNQEENAQGTGEDGEHVP